MSTAEMSTITTPPVQTNSLLEINAEAFRNHFDRKPFLIRHHLVDHPLFQLPRLVELAQTLPADRIEYNAGNVPVGLDPTQTPQTGLSVEETIRRIEECRSWLVLKNIERDPEYGKLLADCIDELRVHSDPLTAGITKTEAFVFITSPYSVTPYHVDPEHNFLLQIRGSKEIHLFNGRDRSILSDEELESYYGGAHRNLTYREEVESKVMLFDLKPGFGLHFPVTYPHWVKNGDNVSISFSVTFWSRELEKRSAVHGVNAWLRRRGWKPTPFEQSRWRDSVKYFTFRVGRRLDSLLGRKSAETKTY